MFYYWHSGPSVSWKQRLQNSRCQHGQTWSCARDNYWHAYFTVSSPCSLPLHRPSCFKKKKKKQLTCSRCSHRLLHNDIALLTHNIYDFGKDKWSLQLSWREVQHEPKGMRGEFRGYSPYKPYTLLTGMERMSAQLQYDHRLPLTLKGMTCQRL